MSDHHFSVPGNAAWQPALDQRVLSGGRWRTRVVSAFATFLLWTGVAHAAQRITVTPIGNDVQIRIDEPGVKTPVTPYPTIRFQAGDTISIEAGGCVQTGGIGQTWKRYVNPDIGLEPTLYHGMIFIPGAMPGLSQLSSWVGKIVRIPDIVQQPNELYLRLGYTDDGYGDNGYYSHDNGTDDQCTGFENINAWVTLRIHHGGGAVTPSAPYDLASQGIDVNGLPLNPVWGRQLRPDGTLDPDPQALPGTQNCPRPWALPCTTQGPTVAATGLNEAECVFGGGPLDGHANWGVATYTGTVRWNKLAFWDRDYNINLSRPDRAGYTLQNSQYLHTEFASSETIDQFSTPWWDGFHTAVDDSDTAAQALLTGGNGTPVEGIEIGVVGLDCAHSCGSELHPVFGLAIHVKDNPEDDVWAIFARNWGNEGWCSTDIVEAPDLRTVGFALPWRPGASGVSVVGSSTTFKSSGRTSVSLFPYQNKSFMANFGLPEPAAQGFVEGELHLRWSGIKSVPTKNLNPGVVLSAPTKPLNTGAVPSAPTKHLNPGAVLSDPARVAIGTEVGVNEDEGTEPETRVAALVNRMPAALKSTFLTLKPPTLAIASLPVSPKVLTQAPSSFRAPTGTFAFRIVQKAAFGRITLRPDPAAAAFQRLRIHLLKTAYPTLK